MTSEATGAMVTFVLTLDSGASYPLEVPVIMGGRELVNFFLDSLKG